MAIVTERVPFTSLPVRILHRPGCGNIVAVAQPVRVEQNGRTASVTAVDVHAAQGRAVERDGVVAVRCPRCGDVVTIDEAVRRRAARAVSDVIENHPTLGPVSREDGSRVGSLRVSLSE